MLGILAINIAGFAGPPAEVYGPVTRGSTDPATDAAIYALWLVLFEGKMRALFSLLFGASMELFVSRAEETGRDGQPLQLRRLLWLAVFGYLHWLLWWGDILFSYAAAGVAALALRQAPRKLLFAGGLAIFALWQVNGMLGELPLAMAESHVAAGTASGAEAATLRDAKAASDAAVVRKTAETRQGLVAQVTEKVANRSLDPLWNAWTEVGEALPYMLIGIALLRGGFFSGGLRGIWLVIIAGTGLVMGGAPTFAFARWAWASGYPYAAMRLAIDHALGFPHLLMALGYAALLVLAAPRLLTTFPGRLLAAAGRMAFSNYIGTTLVMTTLFYGWGLGLVGKVGTTGQVGYVVFGWTLMLGWSNLWLRWFRQGPLEWLWRSLVEGRKLPLRR